MSDGKKVYVVTGATGHIGSRLTEKLLEAGAEVRVVGRDSVRLKHLEDLGAKPFVGTLEDAAFLSKVFSGAVAVFSMIPPLLFEEDYSDFQRRVSDATVAALKNSSVKHVIALSSMGAQHPKGTGPIAGLHYHEQNLKKLRDINVLFLRAAYFMENFFGGIPLLKGMGIFGGPIRGDLKMPMIATRDIADRAASRLLKLDFTGHSVAYVLGERDLSHNEVARVFGRAIGRDDLRYTQFTYEEAERGLVGMGVKPEAAKLYLEMARGMNDGLVVPTEKRTAENTTPTSIEDFSEVFAAAFKA